MLAGLVRTLVPRKPLALVLVATLSACVSASPAARREPQKPALLAAPPAVASVLPLVAIEPPPPPVPRSPFAYANIDPEDDEIVGPPDVRPSCEADLTAAGVKFQAAKLAVHTPPKSKLTCGAPQVVTYKGSSAKIGWSPSVLVTCTMALAIARFETQVQDEALRTFGKKVVTIHHLGTYNCREMVSYPGWVSEHSYANAIDISDFVLEDGRTVDIYKQFAPKLVTPKTKASSFLRAVASRAYREETFSSVLTPFFNDAHATHFHLDLARFRSDGTQLIP